MRIIEAGKLRGILTLGQTPGFAELCAEIEALNVMSPEYVVNEEVFFGTHRVVGATTLGPQNQVYSTASRVDRLNDAVKTQIAWLKTIYPGTVPALVQCATLKPGQELQWHIDTYMYQAVSHKVHIPIWTNDQAFYEYRGLLTGSVNFKIGSAYEINNILMHRSVNHGNTPRTHVIIDMIVEAELDSMLKRGMDPIFTHHPVNKRSELRLLELERARRTS